jgi:mannose-6-phosphate isomerase
LSELPPRQLPLAENPPCLTATARPRWPAMQPLVFQPYLRPQIWGGRQLQHVLGKPLPPEGLFGECWEVSAHPHHVSQVAEGPLRGAALSELWGEYGGELLGRSLRGGEKFPLLVKFLDCRELLSVQVHPDDATARRLTGDELGKTEAWVVLHAEPGSRIFAGLKPGIGREEFQRHLASGTLGECLHQLSPRPGDCLLLCAGTVHAVGGGVLLAEVQQSSDATFRLFDWGRTGPDGKPRQLHVRQALESIDWTMGPVAPLPGKHLFEPGTTAAGEQLAACPYFELRRYRLDDVLGCSPGRMTIWLLLSGAADLATPGGYTRRFVAGETVLIPAAGPTATWRNCGDRPAALLEVRVPSEA